MIKRIKKYLENIKDTFFEVLILVGAKNQWYVKGDKEQSLKNIEAYYEKVARNFEEMENRNE